MAFLDKTGLERLWLHILSKTNQTLASAKSYADDIKNDLLNGAGGAYDTLKELGDLIDENADAIDAIERLADTKSDKGHIHDDRYYTEAEIDETLKFVRDASGEIITINDSADQSLVGLKLYGKTTQATTTGKNLLPYPYAHGSNTNAGITFTINDDGSVTASGTATAQARFIFHLLDAGSRVYLPAGKYTFSGNPDPNISMAIYLYSDNTTSEFLMWKDISNGSAYTFELSEPAYYGAYCVISAGATVNTTIKPILEAGSAATDYEPYTGGIPSPNPNYPQELVNVGDSGSIGVRAGSKNLLPPLSNSVTSNGVTFTSRADGKLEVSGTRADQNWAALAYLLTDVQLPAGEYTLSNSDNPIIVVTARVGRVTGVVDWYDAVDEKSVTFAVNDGDKLSVYVQIPNYSAFNGTAIAAPQLEYGSYVTPFEPYKDGGSVTASTPNGLPGIPVTSGGNYTDASGQMWLCDEIDFERGAYVENMLTITLNGSNYPFTAYSNGFEAVLPSGYDAAYGDYRAISSHLTFDGYMISTNSMGRDNAFAIYRHPDPVVGVCSVFIRMTRFATADELNAWLASNPVTVMYPRRKPIETPLSADELAAYRAMATQNPTTTIYNDSNAWMEVEYADSRIDEIEEALNLPEIDKTLTIDGAAADAKAVRDLVENSQISIDTTLTQEGAAADAKVVGDILNSQYSVKRETGDIISVDTIEGLAIHPTTYIEPVQEGEGDPSPDNVRPISGWEALSASRTGANLAYNEAISSSIGGLTFSVSDDGTITVDGTANETVFYLVGAVTLKPGSYRMSGAPFGGSAGTYYMYFDTYYGDRVIDNGAGVTFGVSAEMTIALTIRVSQGATVSKLIFHPGITREDYEGSYEPYQGQTLSATLPETVYGGTLNWTTGELQKTKQMYQFTGNETVRISPSGYIQVVGKDNPNIGLYKGVTYTGTKNIICSHFEGCVYGDFGEGKVVLFAGVDGTIISFCASDLADVSTFKTYLSEQYNAGTPVTIVFDLLPAYQETLIAGTPQQLSTIEGQNNIWSNAGKTEALINLTPIDSLKNISSIIDSKLDKTTYEYNKELALSYSGKVCIGKFPAYDSNISVEIKSTTDIAYNGTLIIATQNINTTGGGGYSATVYGDATNTLANSIKIHYGSGSNVFSVYIDLPSWSKNLLHIQCVSLAGTPTDIATIVSSIPAEATIVPVNALQATYATKNELSTTANSKQNTVTGAATTITSNDLIANRALVSNGSGKVAASEITGAELHCLDGITDNIQIQLNGKTQRVNLHGQLQTTSYLTSVIALCVAPTTDSSNLNSYSSGRITFQRENALYAPCIVDITMAAAWGAINRVRARFTRHGYFQTLNLCTFTYNGVTYGGIEFKIDNAEASRVTFDGTTTFGIFGLDIYNSDTQTILNEEVYNSISYNNVIVESGIFDGSGEVITTGNIGSQSVNYANSAGSATQDANGNVITSTYATKAEIPKNILDGAASGSLRTLGSPELVKSGSYYVTHTLGADAFAGGWESYAEGENSFAFGHEAWAKGMNSHAEGNQTHADGKNSHAEGLSTFATGLNSHAEGSATHANGTYSHAEGTGTIATSDSSHAQGKYNIEDTASTYAHIVGNGTSSSARSNAHTLDWDGNAWFAGTVEGTGIILKSSTSGSAKRFLITVNDSGTLLATEIT